MAHPTPDRTTGAQLETLLELLGDPVLLLDADHRVIHVNHAFIALMEIGLTPAALHGVTLPAGPASYPHAYTDPGAARARIEHQLSRRRPRHDDRHPMSRGRTVAHDYRPVTVDGTTAGHLWVLRDVSDVDAPGRQAANAAAAARRRSEFAAAVAHELRTPATSVAAFAAMLDEEDLPADSRREASEAVHRNAARMLLLASDLVLLSDLETAAAYATAAACAAAAGAAAGATLSDPATGFAGTRVDLPGLVRAAASASGGSHGQPDELDVVDGPPVDGDTTLLRLAVELTLAVAVTASSGPVRVRLTGPDPTWRLAVAARTSDPVTPERLQALRVALPESPHTTRSAALAVQLIRAIAEKHGGSLTTASDPAGQAHTTDAPHRYLISVDLPA